MQHRGASEATQARILEAAVNAFAANSYDAVSLRRIARDVGIDVALVHRSFGSKEGLFVAVMDHVFCDSHASVRSEENLADSFTDVLFERKDTPAPNVKRLKIVLHSFSNATAKSIIKDRLETNMLAPLRERLQEPKRQRAAVLMGLMLGSVILRNLLEIDGLVDDDGEAEAMIREVIETLAR
ncbi:TetR/AcrR family transcriptional regulator [Acuticoccus sp. I52.16.1]|uniref:TetR/AcrR family transcriptional regulator n=1 Tax=Acuticoccus sp. I52.16.1 TaxID=2928472 RepID=UPI001FD5C07F|nr:TetR/AcrR family transcriptional regulator [Acuticoccus sp. I52.16.1]UOM34356.1 TetR/AcrR family transcriptional regulator [Acuticoccus sp. I52.16.1]